MKASRKTKRSDASLAFSCRCGAVSGELMLINPDEDTHVVCHCKSCRLAMELAGLDEKASQGVDLYQTAPDRIEIKTGMKHLVPKQFSEKGGIYRWHAACCNTPMFNSMKSPAFFFAGVLTCNLTDTTPLGPVLVEGFVPSEDGTRRHNKLPTMIWRFLKRDARARLSGRHRKNWFFDPDGTPVAKPELISTARGITQLDI